MTLTPLSAAVLSLFLLSAASALVQGHVGEGRKAFGRCSSCHAVPDPTLEAEKAWVSMIAESA